jgi:nicotinamide-nucleotide amidase
LDTELHELATRVAQALTGRGWMLATVESCTGGWVAQQLTAIAGSSVWFERGLVTYSNESKQALVGVSAATLKEHGAVSEETAREMAHGLALFAPVQATLAITGIAGPTGGTPEKPVGMVCFAWVTPSNSLSSTTLHFKGDRESVRRQAVQSALEGVLQRL